MVGRQKIPAWLEKFLSDKDLDQIEAAVVKVEARAAVEIVPLIVRRSSTVGHLPFLIFLLLSFATLVVLWPFHAWVDSHHGDFWVPALLLGCLVLSYPLSRCAWLQRILIPDRDEDFQARQRAWAEFAAARISSQGDRRGILLFVSLMERKAVFLVDEGLLNLWSPEDLETAAAHFAQGLRTQSWGQAFETSLNGILAKVEASFPVKESPRNELANHVVIKE